VGGRVGGWVVWAQGVTRASKEKKLPGFSQLESTSSDFDGQGQGGWWILAGQKGLAILLFPGSLMLQRPAVLPVPLLPVLTHVNVVEVMTKWALDPVPIYHRTIYPTTRRPSTTTSLPVRLLGPTIL